MNVLYIAHRIPFPPNKGEKIRAFHQIRYLADRHAIHLACIVDDPRDLPHVNALREFCASVDYVFRRKFWTKALAATAILGRKPLTVASFFSRELARKINTRIRSAQIDRILVYSSAMAEYARGVSSIPRIIDFVDVDSDKWRLYAEHRRFPSSWVFRLESRRLGRYEAAIARSFARSILVTEREAELLRTHVSDCRVSVIANGVDLVGMRPPSELPQEAKPTIVFTGVMDYFPNVDAVRYFCRDVFPLILRDEPGARFYIVGRNPAPLVSRLDNSENIIVTGEVPDVRPYLAEATLAVAPLRISRGVQNKILEAMAMGLPVVTTLEAIGGTQATTADGVRVAESAGDFAREVVTLLREPLLRQECSTRARQYVERCHCWTRHGEELERLVQGAEPTL